MHYLDNAATTKVSAGAAEAALLAMRETFGNPSSLHKPGREALKMLDSAREIFRSLVPYQAKVLFTSGGTESDNLALRGVSSAYRRAGNHVVTTAIEHPAVLETLRAAERAGDITLSIVPPEKNGAVSASRLADAVTEKTVLASMMLVNNETGVVQPVDEAAALIKQNFPNCLMHTDAVQALGKLELCKKADLITLSGHKIHAPKGIGALIVREGVRLAAQMTGGGQQESLRSGTEPMPLIAAFAAAAAEATARMDASGAHIRTLSEHVRDNLRERVPQAVVLAGGLPHILSVALPGAPSEVTMRMLEDRGVYVSAGSACSRGKRSTVLSAMGLDVKLIDAAIRVSFSGDNTQEDADALIAGMEAVCERLKLADGGGK